VSVCQKLEIIHELECGKKHICLYKTQLINIHSSGFVEKEITNFICIREESQYEQKERKCGSDNTDKALLDALYFFLLQPYTHNMFNFLTFY
jgi:hypothetical protein